MSEYRRADDGAVETPKVERRRVGRLELRADSGAAPVIEGYATVYDHAYDIAGGPPYGFSETIARGATAKSAKEADVRFLFDHEGLPLARTKSGTLTLTSDDTGLLVRAELDPESHLARDVISAMTRGDVDEMSFAFEVLRQEWNEDYTERTIREVKLYDVSVVTFPANPATVAHVVPRSAPAPGMSLRLARASADTLRH